jgi:deoxyhypusine synthase
MDPIDLSQIKTTSLQSQGRKVQINAFAKPFCRGGSFRDFLQSLPHVLASTDLREVVRGFVEAHRKEKMAILAMGAHPIKVGLSPVIIQLLEKGVIKAVAMNGAGMIHDLEIAMIGQTSEDVERELTRGTFGMVEETAVAINTAIDEGMRHEWGIGRSLARKILREDYPFANMSILATAERVGIPTTVHVAIGTDINHMHPSANGAAIGEGTHRDFRIFASIVSMLEGGVYLNLGSAVVLPEVFLKALTVARNLGHRVEHFMAINMDFIRHYRPTVNVVERPTRKGGKGITLVGHHEIMVPLLAAAILEEIQTDLSGRRL